MKSNNYRETPKAVKAHGDSAPRRGEGMAGLAKGLAILEAFGPDRPMLTISEAAKQTGTSRAAARRCLLQLAELGYLVARDRHFLPTPRVLRLGAAYGAATTLMELAQPFLTEARDRLEESISLTVLDDGFVVFIARAEAERIVSTGFRIGVRAPAWITAAGRALLAALSEEDLERYLESADIAARTPKTVTDRRMLAGMVEEARRLGYSINDEELETGMLSVAVPVHDSKGKAVAAVSTSTLAARVTQTEIRETFLPVLHETALRIARRL